MRPVCIIPARGGSKRLPRKNILPFNGRPLLTHVVRAAQEAEIFDEIIVSSEDEEILDVAATTGATAYKRDPSIASDRATVVQVCLDVLQNRNAEEFCCIYATAVLLQTETIIESAKQFQTYGAENASVLMGVSEYNYSPLQALTMDDSNNGTVMFSHFDGVQSQFYPKMRVSNGTLYWARRDTFIAEKSFYSKKLKLFDIPEAQVSDLDTQSDYEILLSSNAP